MANLNVFLTPTPTLVDQVLPLAVAEKDTADSVFLYLYPIHENVELDGQSPVDHPNVKDEFIAVLNRQSSLVEDAVKGVFGRNNYADTQFIYSSYADYKADLDQGQDLVLAKVRDKVIAYYDDYVGVSNGYDSFRIKSLSALIANSITGVSDEEEVAADQVLGEVVNQLAGAYEAFSDVRFVCKESDFTGEGATIEVSYPVSLTEGSTEHDFLKDLQAKIQLMGIWLDSGSTDLLENLSTYGDVEVRVHGPYTP